MSFFPSFGFSLPTELTYVSALTGGTLVGGYGATRIKFDLSGWGAGFSDRYVLASVAVQAATGIATATATIAGITATRIAVVDDGSGNGIMLFGARVPTTASVISVLVTLTDVGNEARAHCFGYQAANLNSLTAVASVSDTVPSADALDGTIEVPADGFVIGHVANMGTGGRTFTWTNLTESAETGSYASGRSGATAYSTTAGSALRTATASGGTTNESLLLVAMR